MGVGAAIAIGSQAENGNCALFEVAAIIRRNRVVILNSIFILKFQFNDKVIILIDIRIIISPIRFLSRVIVPEAADLKFW